MSWRTGVAVDGPGGPWTVRRRWLPRLGREGLWSRIRRRMRRTRERLTNSIDFGDGCLPDLGEGIIVALVGLVGLVVIALAVLLLVVVVIPLAIVLLDLLLLAVLIVVGAAAKVLFRRPWAVDAAPVDPAADGLRWHVVGWRASAERCRTVAELLAGGIRPPDADEVLAGVTPSPVDATGDDRMTG